MKVSFTIGTGAFQLVLFANTAAINCTSAKRLAIDQHTAFELEIPDPVNTQTLKGKAMPLSELLQLIAPDTQTEKLLHDLYPATDADTLEVTILITKLSITTSGKVHLSIHNPRVDAGLALVPGNENLAVGIGLKFQSALSFSESDLVCIPDNNN